MNGADIMGGSDRKSRVTNISGAELVAVYHLTRSLRSESGALLAIPQTLGVMHSIKCFGKSCSNPMEQSSSEYQQRCKVRRVREPYLDVKTPMFFSSENCVWKISSEHNIWLRYYLNVSLKLT